MNTVEKGDLFEEKSHQIILDSINNSLLGIHRDFARVFKKKKYYSPKRGKDIIFDLSVDMVQTSCGMGVPYYMYGGDRPMLEEWAAKKGEEGLQQYWENKNQLSLDNIPTHIVKKNINS